MHACMISMMVTNKLLEMVLKKEKFTRAATTEWWATQKVTLRPSRVFQFAQFLASSKVVTS